MSFTKSDLNWLHRRKAKFVNGAFYFDVAMMHVKVCEWRYGMKNENFLCQIDVPETRIYSEVYGETMRDSVQMAVNDIVRQAKILEPLCEFKLSQSS